ncbi:hypothetical protein D3C73_1671910 [compost metagenome]
MVLTTRIYVRITCGASIERDAQPEGREKANDEAKKSPTNFQFDDFKTFVDIVLFRKKHTTLK